MPGNTLVFTLLGVDRLSPAFAKAGRSSTMLAAKLATGFAAASVVAGAAMFKIGSDFDKAYDTIRVGTGATGKNLEGLKRDFKAVVKDVPTDFASAGKAIADLNTRTGATGPQLQKLSKNFLVLSRITKTDLGSNIETVTRLFGDWGIAVDRQVPTMNKLFRASQATGIGVDRLSELMVQFGSPLRQLGLSFDFTTAMFSRFEKEGVNIQTAMPGLRMALKNFAKDGREPAPALMETFKAIRDTSSVAKANTLAFKVFGVRAGPDLAAAIREGRFDLDELMATIKGGSDTILKAGRDTESFGEKWTRVKNRVFVALEPAAMRLFDAISTGMDKLPAAWAKVAPVFNAIKSALKSTFGFVKSNSTVFASLAAGVAAGAAAFGLYKGALAAGRGAVAAFTAVQAALNVVMSANPVGIVVIALAALGAALVVAWKKSETFRNIVRTVFTVVGVGALELAKVFIRFGKAAFDAIWTFVLTPLRTMLNVMAKLPMGMGKPFKKARDTLNGFKTSADKAFDGAIAKVDDWEGALKKAPKVARLKGDIKDLDRKLAAARKGLKDPNLTKTRRAKLEANIRQLIRAKHKAQASLNSLRGKTVIVRANIYGVGSVLAQLYRIPTQINVTVGTRMTLGGAFQHGGYAKSGIPYLVGEKGPEVFVPDRSGDVVPINGSATRAPTAAAALARAPVVLELRSSGSRLDNLLLEVLRNSIRAKGGDVQIVLGSS